MKLHLNETEFIDTAEALDISISLHDGKDAVLAWYCEPIKLEPVMTERFIGDVNQGGAVNFRNLFMNPHGNGTHTECVGHISKEFFSINKCLTEFHFEGVVVTVEPELRINALDQDKIITRKMMEEACSNFIQEIKCGKTLIVRTKPNDTSKLSFNYSNSNPTYFEKEAVEYINELDVSHLMVDLPSIDREEDEGALIGHHTFWNYPQNPQIHKTITELIYVPDTINDGRYLVNIQITSLENDASPSKITLYRIQKK